MNNEKTKIKIPVTEFYLNGDGLSKRPTWAMPIMVDSYNLDTHTHIHRH